MSLTLRTYTTIILVLGRQLFSSLFQNKVLVDNTPAAMMKAMKNDIEVDGMKNAHVILF